MEKVEQVRKVKKVFTIIGMTLGGVILAMVLALLFGFIVMWLWNWLMPDIFGLKTISFWQAWGLVVLAHILFKSFPHHNKHFHDDHWKKRFKDKYCSEKKEQKNEGMSE
jgi:hypothetical protein